MSRCTASLLPQFREWHVLIWAGGYAAIRSVDMPNRPTVLCAETLTRLRHALEDDRPHVRTVTSQRKVS